MKTESDRKQKGTVCILSLISKDFNISLISNCLSSFIFRLKHSLVTFPLVLMVFLH